MPWWVCVGNLEVRLNSIRLDEAMFSGRRSRLGITPATARLCTRTAQVGLLLSFREGAYVQCPEPAQPYISSARPDDHNLVPGLSLPSAEERQCFASKLSCRAGRECIRHWTASSDRARYYVVFANDPGLVAGIANSFRSGLMFHMFSFTFLGNGELTLGIHGHSIDFGRMYYLYANSSHES